MRTTLFTVLNWFDFCRLFDIVRIFHIWQAVIPKYMHANLKRQSDELVVFLELYSTSFRIETETLFCWKPTQSMQLKCKGTALIRIKVGLQAHLTSRSEERV